MTKESEYNIKNHAEEITESPELQKALSEFAETHVAEAKRKLIKKIKDLLPPETQIMLILEDFVKAECNCANFKVKSRKNEILMIRHTFIFLSDYFINTKNPKSDFSKRLLKKTKKKSTNSSKIAEYTNMATHTTILNSITATNNLMLTDKKFKKELSEMILKCELLLNYCYK